MRKIYLLLSILAISAVIFSTTKVNAQYNNAFTVNVDPFFLGWTELPGVDPVFGEPIYKDIGATANNGRIGAGDVRLTPVSDGAGGMYPANSVVAAGDYDIGGFLLANTRWLTVKHAENVIVDTFYEYGEFIYKAASTTVQIGDTRYSKVPGYHVGSVVALGDTDIGTALTTFKGAIAAHFEKFVDSLVVNTNYDYARFFVDVLWSSDIPDFTPDGMRGYQFYCRVDPTVLTPYGWVGATGGYIIADFLAAYGIPLNSAIVGSINPDNLDVSEQILGAVTEGAGDMWTGAKLITLVFIPQSQIDWSPLDLLDISLGYQDAGTEQWHTVTLNDGNYNVPSAPEFPLGIGALMSIVALIPVIYMWQTRKPRRV